MDGPAFDEGALIQSDDVLELQRQPCCQTFGKNFAEVVHQANQAEVLKTIWRRGLPQ
jgi:hypothetical protein